jgi:hypothetical protein
VSQTKLAGKYMRKAYNNTLPGDHAIYSTYSTWLNKQVGEQTIFPGISTGSFVGYIHIK